MTAQPSLDRHNLVLKQISKENKRSLMTQKTLAGISFFIDGNLHLERKYLSVTVNKLKGLWKLSRTSDTHFFVVASDFFARFSAQDLSRSVWLHEGSRAQIEAVHQDFQAMGGGWNGHPFHHQNREIKQAMKQKVKLCLQKYQQHQQSKRGSPLSSQFGRLINVKDFIKVLKYLDSHNSDFHSARIQTAFLHEDQQRPLNFDSKSFFVLTKIDVPPRVQGQEIDPFDQQVFHQFEKLALQEGEAQKFDLYRMDWTMPRGMSVCVNQEDLKFARENHQAVEKHREKQTRMEEELCRSYSGHNPSRKAITVQELEPNKTNFYCSICKIKFTTYGEHIESQAHKGAVNTQFMFFDQIDQLIAGFKGEEKWIHKWKTTPPILSQCQDNDSEFQVIDLQPEPPLPQSQPIDLFETNPEPEQPLEPSKHSLVKSSIPSIPNSVLDSLLPIIEEEQEDVLVSRETEELPCNLNQQEVNIIQIKPTKVEPRASYTQDILLEPFKPMAAFKSMISSQDSQCITSMNKNITSKRTSFLLQGTQHSSGITPKTISQPNFMGLPIPKFQPVQSLNKGQLPKLQSRANIPISHLRAGLMSKAIFSHKRSNEKKRNFEDAFGTQANLGVHKVRRLNESGNQIYTTHAQKQIESSKQQAKVSHH